MTNPNKIKSFILYQEYKKNISLLSQNQKGDLLDAIFSYNEGIEIKLDPIVEMAFSFIKSDLERNKIKYQNIIDRNKINGANGGRPKNPKKPKKPSGLFGNPKEPKETLNDNVNVNEECKSELINDNNNFNIIENHNIKNKFDEFWSFYTPVAGRDGSFTPKGSKAEALQVYEKAIKKFTHEKIMANLEFYLKHCQKNARFTKHACSWLREALKDNFEFEVSLAIEPEKIQQKLTKDQLQDKINEEFLKKYSN